MSPISISSKFPTVGTTIFSVMSALAQKHRAVNLSQGFPDFDCDPELVERVDQAMRSGLNQYAPMPGLLDLRRHIASEQALRYQVQYDAQTEVTICSGATEALFCAIMAIVSPGDEVIVMEPAYDSYIPAIRMAGGIPVCIPLIYPNFNIDWDQLKDRMGPNTKAIILNSPHNPTGSILQKADLDILASLIEGSQTLLISDEVYEHIIFDGARHVCLAEHPALYPRSFIISSYGKSLHTTGWKVGYCMAPAALTTELRKVHQFVTFSTSTPFQQGIFQYLHTFPQKISELAGFYQQKRDHFLQLMEGLPFEALPCQGTYFQLMNYQAISQKTELEFAKWLTTEMGVAVIPVSVFYEKGIENQVVRFCFAKKQSTLAQAAARLSRLNEMSDN